MIYFYSFFPLCPREDSNPQHLEPKSSALSNWATEAILGWLMGLEPTTSWTTIRCSNQLNYSHHNKIISCKFNYFEIDKTIEKVYQQIKPYINTTPLIKANDFIDKTFNSNIYLKYECFQKSGSLKARVAINNILSTNVKDFLFIFKGQN